MSDWKTAHANAANEAVDHKLVEDVIAELADNLGIENAGLPAYGMKKVARYAAMVARAQALGFDPDLLRMSNTEANSHMLAIAAEAVRLGVPTHLLESGTS